MFVDENTHTLERLAREYRASFAALWNATGRDEVARLFDEANRRYEALQSERARLQTLGYGA